MRKAGNRARLAQETRSLFRRIGAHFVHHLERDLSIEVRMIRGVNLAHAAASHGAEYLITVDARPGRQLPDERTPFATDRTTPIRLVRRCPRHEVGARAAARDV